MTQAELIAQAKRDYEAAKLANNKAGMDAAHKAADTARGYTTDPSGTNRVMSYQEALAQAKRSAEGAGVDLKKIPLDENYVRAIQNASLADYTKQVLTPGYKAEISPGTGTNMRDDNNFFTPVRRVVSSAEELPSYQAALARQKATTTTTPQVSTGGIGGGVDTNTLARQLADAQKQKQLSALEQAYQKNLGMLNAEKSTVDPLYDAQNRRAVASSTMGKKSFSDFLAEKGLSTSGLAGQGELSQNIALQGELGGIQADRTGTLADIERRRTGYGEDLAYGRQQAETGADITALEQQMRQAEQDLVDRRNQEADVKNQFLDTITRFANDYQSQINKIRGDADQSNDWQIPYLETARQDKIARGGLDQMGRPIQEAVTQAPLNQSTALALWKSLGTANESIARTLGIPVGTRYTAPAKSTSTSSKTSDPNTAYDFTK